MSKRYEVDNDEQDRGEERALSTNAWLNAMMDAGFLMKLIANRPKCWLVLTGIARHLPNPWLGYAKIAANSGVSIRAISWWVKYLEAIGFFSVEHRSGKTPSYHFRDPAEGENLTYLFQRMAALEKLLKQQGAGPSSNGRGGYAIVIQFLLDNPYPDADPRNAVLPLKQDDPLNRVPPPKSVNPRAAVMS